MYAYEQLLSENNLKPTDLSKDAQIGIKSIKQIENAIRMTEKRGQNVSQAVRDKIKANDKWVVREILDHLEDEETHFEDLPNPAPAVLKEIKQDSENTPAEVKLTPEQIKGQKIDIELKHLFADGEVVDYTFSAKDLRLLAKLTYNTIFNTYSNEDDNGIVTSNYKLIETNEPEIFKLSKA